MKACAMVMKENHQFNCLKIYLFLIYIFFVLFNHTVKADTIDDAKSLAKKGNYKGSVELLMPLADSGSIPAIVQLGVIYGDYSNPIRDEEKSLYYFRMAAEKGDVFSQYRTGLSLLFGGRVKKDESKAFDYFLSAADQGDTRSKFYLGMMYSLGLGVEKNQSLALKYTREAAEEGWPGAKFRLGMHYKDGVGVPQDYKNAIKYFESAVEAGDPQAADVLGDIYYNGTILKQDYSKALYYYEKAALVPNSIFHLGLIYFNGYGVPVDYKKAYSQFYMNSLPNLNNHTQSQIWLGFMYDNGKGVPQDFVRSYVWFNIASTSGDAQAVKYRDIERGKLNPDQIIDAQSKAKECFEAKNSLCN